MTHRFPALRQTAQAADLAGLWHVIARSPDPAGRDRFAITCEYRRGPDGRYALIERWRRGSLGGEVETQRAQVTLQGDGRLSVARQGSLAGALPFLRTEWRHLDLGEGFWLIWDPLRASARLLSRAAHPATNPLPLAVAALADLGLPTDLERTVQP